MPLLTALRRTFLRLPGPLPAESDRRRSTAPAAAVERGRIVLEESAQQVVVLDDQGRVTAASRRARSANPELRVGAPPSAELRRRIDDPASTRRTYAIDGRREELVLLGERDPTAARYDQLRLGFTAVVSHELRTPLARQLALLESALLPGEDTAALIERARAEVEAMRELLDDVLFLSELDAGREVVSLGSTPAAKVLSRAVADAGARAELARVTVRLEVAPDARIPLRERMARIVADNLIQNAIRYAGEDTTCTVGVVEDAGTTMLSVADDGAGVEEAHLDRLFERFYRADQSRGSRGSGLGLAIVKHITLAAGGVVEADGGPGRGLTVRCIFPRPRR